MTSKNGFAKRRTYMIVWLCSIVHSKAEAVRRFGRVPEKGAVIRCKRRALHYYGTYNSQRSIRIHISSRKRPKCNQLTKHRSEKQEQFTLWKMQETQGQGLRTRMWYPHMCPVAGADFECHVVRGSYRWYMRTLQTGKHGMFPCWQWN